MNFYLYEIEFKICFVYPPGESQLANYPGLTRGLVAVLLFYDGQRSLVTALRLLAQARSGRTWSLGVNTEIQSLVTDFLNQLMQDQLVGNLLGE